MQLELRDVCKRFDGQLVLDHVSLTARTGERIGLAGPNGSGKSTLVRAIVGLVRCDGVLRLDGRDPFSARATLAARLAYVPQTPPTFGATVTEVVRAVADLRDIDPQAVHRVASRLGLDLADVATRPVRALSGGMKQKLLIALALAAPASLLVMDEPTTSLDAEAHEAFFALVEERLASATLLLSSHEPDDLARLVDRTVVLEDGRVAREDHPS